MFFFWFERGIVFFKYITRTTFILAGLAVSNQNCVHRQWTDVCLCSFNFGDFRVKRNGNAPFANDRKEVDKDRWVGVLQRAVDAMGRSVSLDFKPVFVGA